MHQNPTRSRLSNLSPINNSYFGGHFECIGLTRTAIPKDPYSWVSKGGRNAVHKLSQSQELIDTQWAPRFGKVTEWCIMFDTQRNGLLGVFQIHQTHSTTARGDTHNERF